MFSFYVKKILIKIYPITFDSDILLIRWTMTRHNDGIGWKSYEQTLSYITISQSMESTQEKINVI